MIDYITHLQTYLFKNFQIKSDLLTQYTGGNYDCYIFVQTINQDLVSKLPVEKLYLLNTEQMSIKYRLDMVLSMAKKVGQVIDYSAANIKILQEYFPSGKYYYWPFPVIFEGESVKTNNLVALISSPYRTQLAQYVGKPIKNFNGMWGTNRNNLFATSKILLNFHFNNEYQILESIRCHHAIEFNTLVISEECRYSSDEILGDFIIFVKDKNFKDCVSRVLNNYDNIYKEKFSPENKKNIETKILNCFTQVLTDMQLKS